MERTLTKQWPAEWGATLCASIAGCCFITLCSLINIPFYPVPFTMQTFAIFVLGLSQTPRNSFGSGICYLASATAGLPVLCGKASSLWILGTSGGYLVAFPIAAWLIAKLIKRMHPYLAILCGQAVIYVLGLLWLIPLFGIRMALMQGVVIFLPSALLKNLAAVHTVRLWKKR